MTKESYSNYKLHVEWRWTAEHANSGVLLHVQGDNNKEWPLCIEAQLKTEKAGDIVMIGHGSAIAHHPMFILTFSVYSDFSILCANGKIRTDLVGR